MSDRASAESIGAFCSHGARDIAGSRTGPLAGLSFAVKDLIDIEGYVTGCGNPDWLKGHLAAKRTAPSVRELLDAGGYMVGKTHTDELAYSLNGENAHYGTPVNVRAPGRIPGGSSSGSAAAVSARLVDFALGTDTGGSVRVPASYCGIYGLRPTHGRISLDGCMPLAPSFDTIGWFADSGSVLSRVGHVLLDRTDPGRYEAADTRGQLRVAESMFKAADDSVSAACLKALPRVASLFASQASVDVAGELETWVDALRVILAAEAWQAHGEWITAANPHFGPGIRSRFAWAASIDASRLQQAREVRQRARSRMRDIVGDDRYIALPTTPCVALPISMQVDLLEAARLRIHAFTCLAGLSGLPQVNLPLRQASAPPVGFSLIGPPRSDETLLRMAVALDDGLAPAPAPQGVGG